MKWIVPTRTGEAVEIIVYRVAPAPEGGAR